MKSVLESTSCSLCGLELSSNPIVEGKSSFCCTGCHAVYNILVAKGEMQGFREHPIFQQAVRSGLISNPLLLEEIQSKKVDIPEEELQRLHLEVEDMWCPSCAEIIKYLILQEKGVRNCVVDYTTDLASIEYSPRYLSQEALFQLISSLGYRPKPLNSEEGKAVSTALMLRFVVAFFCALNLMMFAYPIYGHYFTGEAPEQAHLFAWLSLVAAIPVVFFSAQPIFRRFFTSLQVGIFGMETLVVMGVSTAFFLSLYELFRGGTHVYFDSMTMIVLFVLLGKIIETKAKFSARNSLVRLTKAMPRRGRKIQACGDFSFASMKEIKVGDRLLVLTGEKVVLDGVVRKGEGTCDESVMTGESTPIFKKASSHVLGGSLVKSGKLEYEVTSSEEDSALKRIIEMVEQDIGNKTVYVRAADRIVRLFVPIVILIALTTGLFLWAQGMPGEQAIVRMISILLISCPCAIGIAAPLAESLLMNGLAKLGAIVRNRGVLCSIPKVTTYVFDKTGSITEGKFHVLRGLEGLSETLKRRLKGIALQSNHPISTAIASSLVQYKALYPDSSEEVAGKGLRAFFGKETYVLGSPSFMEENQIRVFPEADVLGESPLSTVYFSQKGSFCQSLLLGDEIKKGAKALVEGLQESLLLSGDSCLATEHVAKICGFQTFQAQCTPLEKREKVQDLKSNGKTVFMLGDGINDAPALTASDVGVSVVTAADISIQVSDILLTTDRLSVLPTLFELAAKGQRVVKQNLFWAFFYNTLGIGLAVFGLLSPVYAALAMVVSSLIVLFNAMRLGRVTN